MSSPLKKVRKELNLTLSDVAAELRMDPGNFSRIERGKQTVSADIAEKIANLELFKGRINEMQILYPSRYISAENV